MSREKQIEEMARFIVENTDLSVFDIAENIGQALYNAGYRKQEWISVDERLPPKNTTVLIFCGGAREMDWICSTGLWYDHDYTLVTHWMPLPEAPKMKGGAE